MADTPTETLKAQREVVTGLANLRAVIGGLAHAAGKRVVEAEAEHDALVKIARYAGQQFEEAAAKLKGLEAEAKAPAGTVVREVI